MRRWPTYHRTPRLELPGRPPRRINWRMVELSLVALLAADIVLRVVGVGR